jgi:hypothetical protein
MLERVPSQYELSVVAGHSIQASCFFSVMRTLNVNLTASAIVKSDNNFSITLVPKRKTMYSYMKMF